VLCINVAMPHCRHRRRPKARPLMARLDQGVKLEQGVGL
jgi:mannitol/fructose-specific phosphotransferase system IIA component (Ntr-type)